jgi:plastocyanin
MPVTNNPLDSLYGFQSPAGAGAGSGNVQVGVAGRIAYYPSSAAVVDDLATLSWSANTNTLSLTGTVEVSGQKNKIRFHWDTLADLISEVSPVNYHGMIAHTHDTGKLYYAHAGAWVPVASESSLPNTFSTVTVAGQSDVVADTTTDTLTLAAGSNITITTNDSTDTITISATGGGATGNVTFAGNTIDTADSTPITITPAVNFDSNVVVGNVLVFSDGTTQSTAQLIGPSGAQGPAGASGAGSGDVLSSGGGYVDNAIIRYDGITGTIIQNSTATINDAGLLTATNFSGGGASITALNATQLTSGTVPDARFPATLPAASGVNLTALNATNLGSGTVPVLRLGDSGTRDATTYLRGDNTWATVAAGASSNSFETIVVAGQSSVVADSATDTLTLVAGSNITLTTNAGTDTITIAAAGGSSNSFETISVAGQSNVVADSATDTLTLAAGTGISITTNAGSDTVTITSTVTSGATTFAALTDTASLTTDKIYLPAITRLDVTNNVSSSYRFDQYGAADNPTVYALNGATIAFNLNVAGHPFLIQTSGGSNYDTGLTHVTTGGTVTTGGSAQGKTSGTLYWKIPSSISGNYRYQCSIHGGMVGVIDIKAISAIP